MTCLVQKHHQLFILLFTVILNKRAIQSIHSTKELWVCSSYLSALTLLLTCALNSQLDHLSLSYTLDHDGWFDLGYQGHNSKREWACTHLLQHGEVMLYQIPDIIEQQQKSRLWLKDSLDQSQAWNVRFWVTAFQLFWTHLFWLFTHILYSVGCNLAQYFRTKKDLFIFTRFLSMNLPLFCWGWSHAFM